MALEMEMSMLEEVPPNKTEEVRPPIEEAIEGVRPLPSQIPSFCGCWSKKSSRRQLSLIIEEKCLS